MAIYNFTAFSPTAFNAISGGGLTTGGQFQLDPGWDTQNDGYGFEITDDDTNFGGDVGGGADEVGSDTTQDAIVRDASGTTVCSGQAYLEAGFVFTDEFGSTVTLYQVEIAGTIVGYIADGPIQPGNVYTVNTIINPTDVPYASLNSETYDEDVANTIQGTSNNDTLTSDSGSDVIDGGDGDDFISSGNDGDTVFGGAGNDTIDSTQQTGATSGVGDYIDGGTGNDSITGSNGNDTILGGDGNDSIFGLSGADSLDGGNDADTFFLENTFGADTVIGGEGGTDSDTIDGGALGSNVTVTFTSDEAGTLTDGTDTLSFTQIENVLTGTGDDSLDARLDGIGVGLFGNGGSDTIRGGTGDDYIEGGDDADSILIEDGFGTDTIFGGEGGVDFDVLDLSGHSGPVTVTFTDEEDGTITNGTDTLSFFEIERLILTESNDSVDATITHSGLTGDAPGVDIDARGGNDTVLGGRGGDTIDGGAGMDLIDGDYGDDSLLGGDDSDTITGGLGNDTILGGTGADSIDGGDEADTLDGGADNDTIVGGDGDDSIIGDLGRDNLSGGSGRDTIDGGADNDTIDGGDQGDTIYGGDGDDLIEAGEEGADGDDDYIEAGAGNDTITSAETDSQSNDTILGGDGRDFILVSGGDANVLDGGTGNDTVVSASGNDSLTGGIGDDILTGGGGNDTFTYTAGDGNDTITDFNTGNTGTLSDGDNTNNDFIDLSAFYDNIRELHADQADDGVLNQSNDGVDGVDYSDNTSFGSGSLNFAGASADNTSFTSENTGVVCFTTGTAIRTPRGDVLIEDLRVGDLVSTADNGPQPIRWIGTRQLNHKTLLASPNLRPVLIKAEVLGNDRPLLVSPQHCMLLGPDRLVRAKHLAETKQGVRIAHGKRSVCYIHLMFDAHQIIFAENALSESFYPGPMSLQMMGTGPRGELLALFPALGVDPNLRALTTSWYGGPARPVLKRRDLPDIALARRRRKQGARPRSRSGPA